MSGLCTSSKVSARVKVNLPDHELTRTWVARLRIELNSSSVSTKSCRASASKHGVWTAIRTRAARCHSAILDAGERKPDRQQRYHMLRNSATSITSTGRRGSSFADVKNASSTGIRLRRAWARCCSTDCVRKETRNGKERLRTSGVESPFELLAMPVSTKSDRSSTTKAVWSSGRVPAAVASSV